jgi:DNA-binding transcriptional MerR regulator
MDEARWTLDELAERVDAALAVDYPGQPSGRVRDVPDRRAIRWYTTIGLIDRPAAHRGRTAFYGPRHLLQLVAVKRLQARGLPLVAIQQELAGATDTQLARVARLPATAPAARVADGAGPSAGPPAPPRVPARTLAPAGARRAGFWRAPPAAALTAARAAGPDGASADPDPGAASVRGVRLGGGATLLLEPGRELDAGDVQAILEAAGPLLAALRARGLDRAGHRREHP